MSYCSASDVQSVNRALILGQGNNPTPSDVGGYCAMISGEIDAVLLTRGYSVPISTASFPEAQAFLQSVAVKGAVWMCWESIGTVPDARDKAKAAYDAAMKMLSDAKFSFDAPSEPARAQVRAPFITYQPPQGEFDPMLNNIVGAPGDGISDSSSSTSNPTRPMFSRSMQF